VTKGLFSLIRVEILDASRVFKSTRIIKEMFRKYKRARGAFRPKSRTAMRRPSKYSTARMQTLIRRTVLRVAEPKSVRHAAAKVELYHNSMSYVLHLNDSDGMPTQGTADTMRVGDEIMVSSFKVRSLIGQKTDRPNVTFVWYLIEAPKGLSPTYANLFHVVTGNVLLDEPNTDSCKVLKRGKMRPNEAGLAGTGGDEYTFSKVWHFTYKRKYKFGPANATTAHNQPELYLIIMAYDAYGSLVTDNIAYIQSLKETFYKDP